MLQHAHVPSSDHATTAYTGPERRRHRVYVTRNTEYHFRDGRCVAVRNRRTGEFLAGHLAIRGRVDATLNGSGALRIVADGSGEPQAGDALYFGTGGRDLVTSPLESIGRPAKDLLGAYPDTDGG